MLVNETFIITAERKAHYDEIEAREGRNAATCDLFGPALYWGYGVYGHSFTKLPDGRFEVRYSRGSSCE